MADKNSNAPGREIGRKLSIREMGFDKERLQELVIGDKTSSHFIARFVGVVSSLKPYKIKEGEQAGETAHGLMGTFEGSNNNGDVVSGSVLYLPSYVHEAIVAIFSADDEIASVRIAFDIYARYDKDSATSYTFIVNDLLNTGSQAVEEVKNEIQALPMPSDTIALEDKSKE